MIFGYCRVSSEEQHLDRQLEELEGKVDRFYCDKKSGKNTDREQLQAMLSNIRPQDRIEIISLCRLSRSLKDIIDLIEKINSMGATIHFIKEGFTFTPNKQDPFQKLMLSMMGAINEFYRENQRQMQLIGIKLAQKRGAYAKPRRKKLNKGQILQLKEECKTNSIASLAKKYGVSRPTIYEYLKIA